MFLRIIDLINEIKTAQLDGNPSLIADTLEETRRVLVEILDREQDRQEKTSHEPSLLTPAQHLALSKYHLKRSDELDQQIAGRHRPRLAARSDAHYKLGMKHDTRAVLDYPTPAIARPQVIRNE